ncbi:MAG: hypothetical protein OIF35_08320 [Cellvibrionaceae bacterium]|nr:hypothetical protein [Cellvibrionaceae bacterium]MCV6625661.1 hypothetical protein [Cellvibrionaceae bacterium]
MEKMTHPNEQVEYQVSSYSIHTGKKRKISREVEMCGYLKLWVLESRQTRYKMTIADKALVEDIAKASGVEFTKYTLNIEGVPTVVWQPDPKTLGKAKAYLKKLGVNYAQ